jgi:cupin 2 domain-containing protein
MKGNIFNIDSITSDKKEVFESILTNENITIERIVTLSPYEQPGEWYDQPKDEWVILLQGEAEIEFNPKEFTKLSAGDYIFIPAHKIHRIKQSSSDKRCIWLAIHGNLK